MSKENQKPSLLIVDDEPLNVKMVLEYLRSDYNIRIATSGERAIEITMSETPPDLILLDIMMPKMDGYEVCTRIKNDPITKDIPVIFLTAKTDTESVVKGFRSGAVDYVTKPFREEELQARVKSHMSLLMQQRALDAYAGLLESDKKQLEELNATKDKFFSIIAHDLKNPVANVLSFVDLLGDEQIMQTIMDNEFKTLITALKTSVKSLYELLENLLTWARSQRGMIQYNPSSVEIANIAEINIALLDSYVQKKQIKLVQSVQSGIFVHADIDMLNAIVRNLLFNAVKFTKPGGIVEIKAEPDKEEIKVMVSDTGIGISQETIEKLFHIENKTQRDGTADEKGTGLGLILCKEFVEKHNGKIWVESQVDKGTNISFTLPIYK